MSSRCRFSRRGLERLLGRLVGDEVAQLRLVLVADRLLQRDRHLRDAQDVAHLADRASCSSAAISAGSGSRPEALHELALDVGDPVQLLDHVHGDPDRPRLVGDRPGHRLADPPGRVGRELVAAAVVELLHRADQPQRALLDQVEEAQAAAQVALRDRDDQPQVGLDHVALGGHVAAARSASRARPPGRRSAARPARSSAGRGAASRGSARPSGRARASSPAPAGLAPWPPCRRSGRPRRSRRRRARSGRRAGRCTCSLVTSTSSSVAAICSKVR